MFHQNAPSNVLLAMDFHAHLMTTEIIGFLAGEWDKESPTPSVTTPLSTSSSSPSSTLDTPVLQSFTISTKTNVEYNHINQLLHTVHVNRYGDPELHEGWWQDSSTNNEIDYMDMDPTNTYQDINTTLRQAFLQRHHHP